MSEILIAVVLGILFIAGALLYVHVADLQEAAEKVPPALEMEYNITKNKTSEVIDSAKNLTDRHISINVSVS